MEAGAAKVAGRLQEGHRRSPSLCWGTRAGHWATTLGPLATCGRLSSACAEGPCTRHRICAPRASCGAPASSSTAAFRSLSPCPVAAEVVTAAENKPRKWSGSSGEPFAGVKSVLLTTSSHGLFRNVTPVFLPMGGGGDAAEFWPRRCCGVGPASVADGAVLSSAAIAVKIASSSAVQPACKTLGTATGHQRGCS